MSHQYYILFYHSNLFMTNVYGQDKGAILGQTSYYWKCPKSGIEYNALSHDRGLVIIYWWRWEFANMGFMWKSDYVTLIPILFSSHGNLCFVIPHLDYTIFDDIMCTYNCCKQMSLHMLFLKRHTSRAYPIIKHGFCNLN